MQNATIVAFWQACIAKWQACIAFWQIIVAKWQASAIMAGVSSVTYLTNKYHVHNSLHANGLYQLNYFFNFVVFGTRIALLYRWFNEIRCRQITRL